MTEIRSLLGPNVPEPPKAPVTSARSGGRHSVSRGSSEAEHTALGARSGSHRLVETNHAALRPVFADAEWPAFENLVRGYAFADAQARLEQALNRMGQTFAYENV